MKILKVVNNFNETLEVGMINAQSFAYEIIDEL